MTTWNTGEGARDARWVWTDVSTTVRPEALRDALGRIGVEPWALPRAHAAVRLIARDAETLHQARLIVDRMRVDRAA